jgi:Tfp pilus assembly protein PilX
MISPTWIIRNSRGSAIVVALLLLVTLTIIGLAAASTSVFESRIIRNDQDYQIDFYVADSGWKEAAMWLDNAAGPPGIRNGNADNIVKNWGNVADADPSPGIQDSVVIDNPDNTDLSQYGVPYWYQVQYSSDTIVAGSGPGFREFIYDTKSNANQSQRIDVRVSKIFKVGY